MKILIGAAGLVLLSQMALAQGQYDGTYEYVAPGARGALLVQQGSTGATHFEIFTERAPFTCTVKGTGQVTEERIVYDDPDSDLMLTVRFFANNAEVTAEGPLPAACETGSNVAGVYILINRAVFMNPDTIRIVQTGLNQLGFPAGPVDGDIGRRTRTALTDFQNFYRLPVTPGLTLEATQQVIDTLDAALAEAEEQPPEAPTVEPPVVGATIQPLVFTANVPAAYIEWLDQQYAGDIAPQQIDWADAPFEVAIVDLDTTAGASPLDSELIVFWNDVAFCGDDGCRLEVLRYDAGRARYLPVLEAVAQSVELTPEESRGVRNLMIDSREVWSWNGRAYAQDLYRPRRVR